MQLGYIGLDNYGDKYFIKKNPRKELLEQLYATRADKIYRDTKDGKTKHVGYVIRGRWIEVYKISEWKEATK